MLLKDKLFDCEKKSLIKIPGRKVDWNTLHHLYTIQKNSFILRRTNALCKPKKYLEEKTYHIKIIREVKLFEQFFSSEELVRNEKFQYSLKSHKTAC